MHAQAEPGSSDVGERSPLATPVTIVAHDVGDVGGMERVLAELILGLRARGHELTVIARTCALPASAGVRFHRVWGPRRPALLAYPWFMFAGSIVTALRRRGVVQATGAIVLNRVDVVAVHYCHQIGPANPSRSSPLFRLHAALVSRMLRVAERLCFRASRGAAFVGVSEGVAAEVREHYPELGARTTAIHNGVDVEGFAPGAREQEARARRAQLGIAPGRLLAAFVGSEWERKGLEPLIRALARAPGWDVLVAGDGDRERYQALADSLGVGEAIHWLGVTRDVGLVYALADAFVLPSAYETFSLVTFEAAASGLPLLATPVSGVRELIEDGRNGYLIDREPATIARRLVQLGGDAGLRARLGAGARESALAFGWGEMVAKHERLYAQVSARG
ncbi:MAG TPA: glycosyltransferase family 4 protein [Solirubrobacteraceae bacterium]|nr:glycosyltransferase family 4 protein [Solirubrobacteraceae bacterium]